MSSRGLKPLETQQQNHAQFMTKLWHHNVPIVPDVVVTEGLLHGQPFSYFVVPSSRRVKTSMIQIFTRKSRTSKPIQ